VNLVEHPKFGIDDEDSPLVQSSRRSLEMAKPDYRNISFRERVEKEYLYSTLLGSDLLPFCSLPYRIVVLPVNRLSSKYHVINKEIALSKGHDKIFQWLCRAEDEWKKVNEKKSTNMTIYQRLNRGNGITGQNIKTYGVLYNAAGRGNLTSCVLNLANPIHAKIKDVKLTLSGFVAEHKTYVYYTEDDKEATYQQY
jgi:hypothetical protein